MSLVLALAVAATLLDSHVPVREAPLRAGGVPPLREVLHDEGDDGQLYAAGANYKMIFGQAGAQYVPLLGARAPQNSRIEFHVGDQTATTPVRSGNRITFDRGALVEIYDLGADQVEQSFLLRAPLSDAELRVSVTTDATYAGRDAAGLRFDAQGLATITYGDATLVDARGKKTTVAARFENGAIRIGLPAAWQDAARYPIVIDPVISTFLVDGGADTAGFPDVAYAPANNVFQVSYTREFSATDSDIHAARFETCGGALLDTIAVDISLKNSRQPRVALSGSHFMTVWSTGTSAPNAHDYEIEARARVSGSTAQSARFRVSGATNVFPAGASIGGGGPGGSFLVAYYEFQFGRWRIMGRLVSAAGNVDDTFEIDDTMDQFDPQVSPTPTAAGRWLVAYTRQAIFASTFNIDIFARQVTTSGATAGNAIAIGESTQLEQHPAIATDGTSFFVAFDRTTSIGSNDVLGRTVTSGTNPVAGTLFNLSALEPGVDVTRHQREPALSFDGVRYALAYTESVVQSVNSEIRGATFFATPGITFQEGHVLVPGLGMTNFHPRLAGAGFDIPGRHLIAWSQRDLSTGDEDVKGAFWSTLQNGGGKTVLNTGCGGGGLEPIIASASVPALGTTLTISLLNFHAPLVAVGPPLVLAPCAGTTCQFGVGGTTYFPATSTTLSIPIGTSPSLLGTVFAVQGHDFNLPPNATEFCTQASGQTFTTSDTLVFTVQ